ncbi:MAG: LptF/LptG family permease [Planctomycetota bacterium]
MFPKLITRYVIWELTKIFLISSFAFVALMLIVGIADEARDRGLGPEILVQLIPFLLPKALMFAMPATCLFSVCVVFGRMAADNEMIAIKSMGLPQSVVVLPVLALAFLLSLFAVWVNDVSFAWSYWGIERVVLESSDKILYGVLADQGSFKTDEFSIEVQGVEDRTLIQPVITGSRGGNPFRLVAESATLTTNLDTHELVFAMNRCGFVDEGGQQVSARFDKFEQSISLKSPEEFEKQSGNPSHLYLSQIGQEIERQHAAIEDAKEIDAVRACSQMLTGDLIGLTNSDWEQRLVEQGEATFRLRRLHVVPHRRWANGFSCLAFAMIGIPIALRLKTANYATTFGVCFLPILLIYYPLFMFGLTGAKEGTLPPAAAWLGNIVCMLIGAILMYRQFKR